MNTTLEHVSAGRSQLREHFRFLHQHPGLAFQETEAADYIARMLREWGYDVTQGIGRTGVVGRLKLGTGTASIGLRADTDALPMTEGADLPYKSRAWRRSPVRPRRPQRDVAGRGGIPGTYPWLRRHAQPDLSARRGDHGRRAGDDRRRAFRAIPDGLGLRAAQHARGCRRASSISVQVPSWLLSTTGELLLTGVGSHGSMPERSVDPVVAGAALVMSLQSIVSRNVAPMDAAVVSVGAFLAGDAGT